MIWHPLSLTIMGLDALSLLFVLAASLSALRVVTRWDPASTSAAQISMEAAVDVGALATRFGLVFFLASSALLLFAIAQVFPPLVQGAMCGTGVLEAMGSGAWRSLASRLLAVAALWVWMSLEGVNRRAPRPQR